MICEQDEKNTRMRRLAFIFSPGYFFHLKCPKRGSRDLVSAALVGFVKLASHLRSGQGVRRGHSSGRRHEIDTRLRDPTRCHEAIPLSCGEEKNKDYFGRCCTILAVLLFSTSRICFPRSVACRLFGRNLVRLSTLIARQPHQPQPRSGLTISQIPLRSRCVTIEVMPCH